MSLWEKQSDGELDFTLKLDKEQVQKGDDFQTQVILTNTGNYTFNVWELKHQISYDIHIYDSDESRIKYVGGVIQRIQLENDFLRKLNPGESIKSTKEFETEDWGTTLDRGNYTINAVYHTHFGENIWIPYWIGSVESNNVTLVVK
ncbi:hypothetical protein [Methanohalobium sp.]|uniref:hypothetical protein n=1 Tax=Methanohalobium sp. TaxID=2837493 RepID=UPI0025EC2533|nr:hypothetical protein [Methanohalobium sp.]